MTGTPARALARAVRRAPERLAHPLRHRRALEQLARADIVPDFLFVCHGNVCRSPYAALAFARALPAELAARARISSAGFVGPNRAAPLEAVRAAARRGIDLSAHRSRLVTGSESPRRGLVLVMNAIQRQAVCRLLRRREDDVLVLGDLDPGPIDTREIRDPWGAEEDIFDASYERIDRCVGVLAAVVAGSYHGARAEPGAGGPHGTAAPAPVY